MTTLRRKYGQAEAMTGEHSDRLAPFHEPQRDERDHDGVGCPRTFLGEPIRENPLVTLETVLLCRE